MYEFRAWSDGVLLEVRILVIVWRSWGWVIPDIAVEGGFMFRLQVARILLLLQKHRISFQF